MFDQSRPKSGVIAVGQGSVFADSLRSAVLFQRTQGACGRKDRIHRHCMARLERLAG
jgi:hypothetical protein